MALADRIKPTEKQLNFIADIEKFVGDTFDGETRQEASKWIEEHLDEFNQMRQFWEEECIIASYQNC